jgi:tetratricopeptide (TPR) repeat protein
MGSDRRRPGLKHRIEEELRATDKAIQILTELTKESPDEVRFRVELARAHRDRSKVAVVARNRRESESSIARSISLFDQLRGQYQDSEAIRYELAVTLSSTEAFGFNPLRRAIRAEELSRDLLADSPDQPRYLALRAHTLTVLARFQARNDKADEAAESLDQAIEIYESLATNSPEVSLYATRSSQAVEAKADLQHRQGKTESAVATLRTAVERLQKEVRRSTASPVAKMQLQRLRQKMARLKDAT